MRLKLVIGSCAVLLACNIQDEPGLAGTSSGGEDPTAADAETDTGSDTPGTMGGGSGASGDTMSADSTGDTTGDSGVNASPGCGGDPGAIPATLPIEGTDREFFFVLPDDYDPTRAYPLVFAWHALGTSGVIAQAYYGVEQQAAGQAIFVYPDGLVQPGLGGTGWNLEPNGYDMVFFDELYDQLTSNLCIDLDRVFSTGHSFGGFMSNTVACLRGDRFAAIAPVAGGGPFVGCDGPMAAWIAHGTADGTVPYSVGQASYQHWLDANGCDAASDPTDPSPCVAHQGCDAGAPLVWCSHDEAQPLNGHHWPDWAGPAIWEFFSGF